MRRVFPLIFLFMVSGVFAAIPIQEKSLQGSAAAEARLRLLAAAESYLGVPYRYGGNDRKGMDCSGFVYTSFRDALRQTTPRTAESIYLWTEKIETAELALGDLVFFVTSGAGISHVGIYAGDGRFIHSASEGPETGVIYSRLDESYWKRTYRAAGRALPWDAEAARAMAAAIGAAKANPSAGPQDTAAESGAVTAGKKEWGDPGFFTGLSAAWTWGGFFKGAPSPFRGISALATLGYKGSGYRLGLELRYEWDRALDVYRLPVTLSFGNNFFQVFGGAAYTFGDPGLELSDGERHYRGGDAWLWEAGVSGAFPPLNIGPGALSFYGELALQRYPRESGAASFWPDLTANLRLSTGLRFFWHL